VVKAEKSSFVQIVSESAQTRFSFTAVSIAQTVREPVSVGSERRFSVRPTGRGILPHGNETMHNSTDDPLCMLMSERVVASVSQGAQVNRSLDRQKLVLVILLVSASNMPYNRALGQRRR
jgi:hypothetical protein